MSAQALAAWDTENRFRTLAAQGDVQQALAILDRWIDWMSAANKQSRQPTKKTKGGGLS